MECTDTIDCGSKNYICQNGICIDKNPLNGEEGVDLFALTSIDKFKCLKEKLSVKFVIVRASRSNGYFDDNAVANIENAWAAGIKEVDIYIWPCVKPKLVENVICDNAR
uniref:Hyaluronoglucosaminidase n=1 Tax=Meloidogyne incognita TaxID=6306 RepID=A0A914LYT8_MELIC